MRRATAVRHLVEMADIATDDVRLRETTFGWPLVSLWATGELLGGADALEVGSVIVVLELPADELAWLALHPTGEWVGSRLGLGKRPLLWCYRPAAWPAWNAHDKRVLRFWSEESGLDDEVIDGLRERRRLSVVEPTREELINQLCTERAVSARHLREVLDRRACARSTMSWVLSALPARHQPAVRRVVLVESGTGCAGPNAS